MPGRNLDHKAFWLIFALAVVVIIGNIGTGSLTTWDEAVYANVSKGILKSANWIVLQLNGKPWFEKPPLYMWLTAIFYNLFGINEFTTRITSAIFAVATVLLLYIFVKRSLNKRAAIFSALVLLSLPHYLHFAKMGMLEVVLTFFIVLMVYFFELGLNEPIYLFLSGIILLFAYLTKGMAAFLGLGIICVYGLFSARLNYLFKREFVLGVCLSGLVVFFWHFLQYLMAGPDALSNYFGYHIYQRALQGIEGHRGGLNFYQKAIFNKNMPWGIVLYLSFLYTLWLAFRRKENKAILLCCWVLLTYILYSAIKTKLHWYIIPIYPGLAFACGIFLERLFRNRAFNIAIIVVLVAIILETRFSWAFNLDLNPEVKKVSAYARGLSLKGYPVYMVGIADTEIFYCDFARILDEGSYRVILEQKQPQEAFCIIVPEYLKDASLKYNFNYQPLFESSRISLYKIRFKGI